MLVSTIIAAAVLRLTFCRSPVFLYPFSILNLDFSLPLAPIGPNNKDALVFTGHFIVMFIGSNHVSDHWCVYCWFGVLLQGLYCQYSLSGIVLFL